MFVGHVIPFYTLKYLVFPPSLSYPLTQPSDRPETPLPAVSPYSYYFWKYDEEQGETQDAGEGPQPA